MHPPRDMASPPRRPRRAAGGAPTSGKGRAVVVASAIGPRPVQHDAEDEGARVDQALEHLYELGSRHLPGPGHDQDPVRQGAEDEGVGDGAPGGVSSTMWS